MHNISSAWMHRWNLSNPMRDMSSELMHDIPFELINDNSESMQGNANDYNHGYCSYSIQVIIALFPHSWFITGFITRLTRRVSLEEQELFTLSEHLSKPPVFSGVRVTRSLVLCVCLPFYTFSFGYCVVCSSSTYGFWLLVSLWLWYLQTRLDSGKRLSVSNDMLCQ